LIVFGDDLSGVAETLEKTPPEFLVLQTAYTSALLPKPARAADVIIPAPAFGEVYGHVLNKKHGKLAVNAVLAADCGFQTRQLIPILSDGEVTLR
jgi:hypothetical protein